jgi:cytochrome c553
MVAGGALALLAAAFALGAAAVAQPAAEAQDDAPAGDPLVGRKLARACAACHGVNGIASTPDAANLAGQNASYIIRQLRAFRSGERKNDTMSIMAATLTDAQIANMAAYYGQIQIEVTKVPGQ